MSFHSLSSDTIFLRVVVDPIGENDTLQICSVFQCQVEAPGCFT